MKVTEHPNKVTRATIVITIICTYVRNTHYTIKKQFRVNLEKTSHFKVI